MANEPERPIERLLRESAQKRREEAAQGPGFELHPATRRLLQGEVARRFGRPTAAGRKVPWRWTSPFFPRLVEACVLVALLAVVVSVLLPALRTTKEEPMLAKNEPADAGRRAGGPALAPAATPAANEKDLSKLPASGLVASADQPSPPSAKDSLGLESSQMKQDLASSAGGPPVVEARRSLGTLAQNKLEVGGTTGLAAAKTAPVARAATAAATRAESPPALTLVPAAPPPPMAVPPPGNGAMLALAESKPAGGFSNASADGAGQARFGYKALPGGVTGLPSAALADASGAFAGGYTDELKEAQAASVAQRFAQVPPRGKVTAEFQDKVEGPVLASFQVEQSGRTFKVIDSDGSVYTGSLQTSQAKRARSSERVAPDAAPSANAPMGQGASTTAGALGAGQTVRFFRVTGTNQSLKQKVVFSGTLSSVTNGVVAGTLLTRQGAVSPSAPGVSATESLQNCRINGQVVIGRGKPTNLEAVPVP